ncbi:uncharacterized protein BX664DRAFT_271447 [Halteromyces radiatus]|uniref:uncharacterized protein n=1 Tax=Halteromyces radiatus TaxID=101107 RepID=UPI00221E78EE|nr:uncharacterized protein BX664DRAFT_271447 [Halteromyces radiatus]KAI8098691.1 hypothetical protein BX664DRAFT_271447 [Halteromyces radiatus]
MAQVNNSGSSSRANSPPHTPSRSRSNSIMRGLLESPALNPQQPTPTRRNTTNDNLLSRLPSLHHHHHHEESPLSAQSLNQLSDAQLSNKPEDYELKEPIGYGSSAVVYAALYKPSNRKVAMKVIDLDMFERNQIDELRRETALMALSKHPNVLRVYGSFVSGSKLYIITPYLSAGSCLDIMKTSYPDGFDEITIATILKQALEGLIYLHKNGHIHRDVKAGNLLMDEYGLVQLADFGVSSSLTENNEVRKTFVGTPCWMAPEVMEQAGYDFKADIWSFGITAIELATGHAPFAKYSPMKVLMMTLSQDPPTLSRENAKHKFSKMIKEMIDTCLQKDPKKRPTAEKLLQHPFFRQAKRKDFLMKSVLTHVPALDRRPHKKVPQKHITFESTDQWDFDTLSDNEDATKNITTPTTTTTTTTTSPPPPPQPTTTTTTATATATDDTSTSPTTPGNKKHISFGNVVIKSLPQHNDKSSPIEVPDSSTSPSSKSTSPDLIVPTPHRKSRFVVGENQIEQLNAAPTNQHSMSSINEQSIPQLSATLFSPTEKEGVGLGISGATATPPISSSSTSSVSGQEVKKGRFSVNQTSQRTASVSTPSLESGNSDSSIPSGNTTTAVIAKPTATPITTPSMDPHDIKSTPVARVGSSDSLRKSRFAVHHSPMATTEKVVLPESLPLSRNPSVCGSLPNGKVSRFSVAKDDSGTKNEGTWHGQEPASSLSRESSLLSHDTPNSTILSEGRKKGRFQLSGIGDMKFDKDSTGYMESPQSSVSSYSPNSSFSRGQSSRFFDPSVPSMVYYHMENLYKQAEAQKVLLHDMLSGLSLLTGQQPPSSSSSTTKFNINDNKVHDGVRSRSGSLSNEISHTFDHLQYLLQVSCKEREQLQKENDSLKRELDRLRRSLGNNVQSSGNRQGSATPNMGSSANEVSSLPTKTPSTTLEPVVDPLPPSPLEYFVPSRPHTTSPSTTTLDSDKLKSASATTHLPGGSSPLRSNQVSDESIDNKENDLNNKNNTSESTTLDSGHSSILPTPSSSYTWVSKSTNAPEALHHVSSP